jgi:hypothetical protein
LKILTINFAVDVRKLNLKVINITNKRNFEEKLKSVEGDSSNNRVSGRKNTVKRLFE